MKFISGLRNCHTPGLYSMVLEERRDDRHGMSRVFYASETCRMDRLYEHGDFFIKPHNHRQDIRLIRLAGKITNVGLRFGHGEERAYCYSFRSGLLRGEFDIVKLFEDSFSLVETEVTMQGLSLHWSDVHTVVAEKGSIWLIEEGLLAPPDTARCWSLSPRLELDISSLYEPINTAEISVLEEKINAITHENGVRL